MSIPCCVQNKSGIGTGPEGAPLTLAIQEDSAMGFFSTAALTHELDEEWKALTTLGLTLDAAKQAATHLMQRYPDHRTLAQSVLDFAEDGGSDIVGALSGVEARMPRYRERGGAT
jgi:hypothetical protein